MIYQILYRTVALAALCAAAISGPGGASDAYLLEDGSSGILLEDGISYILME